MNIHIMVKFIPGLLLMFFSFPAITQVTFYGNPEPVQALNSSSGENYIYLENAGNTIFLSRENHPLNSGATKDKADIWRSILDSTWSSPENLPFNDEDFSSPLGFTADGNYFLYNKVWFDKTRFYGGVYGIEVRDWGKEMKMEIPYLRNRSPIQTGSISIDGRYMLLSLENSTGYGVDDLYVSVFRSDGTWSPVKNLGRAINTQFQELTPFLAADNKTLFFASNGRGGHGSFDLFKATRLDETWQNWSEPENLGSVVNTSGSETSFAFLPGAGYAYFVSTQNSDGYGDVKRIKITTEIEEDTLRQEVAEVFIDETPDETPPLIFRLQDGKTGDPISGRAIMLNEEDSTILQSDNGGEISVPYSGENVSLEFKAQGYLSVHRTVDEALFGDENEEQLVVSMEPLAAGNTITLRNVLFYRGTANFVEGSERELELVAEMMRENPEVDIFLKGHTDNVGNDVLNVQLSQARVEAVTNFLIDAGISADRISGKGFGGSEPIASNAQEETRKLNRRVEFEIRRD